MLGCYPNSNAKLRGRNLNEKIQALVSWTFQKHLCGLTYIDTSIYINKHKHTHKYTYTHTHLLTNKHT